MTAATATPELCADNGYHLDSLLAQSGIGVRVAVIGENHTWRCADKIGATVPLRPLAEIGIPAGLHDAQLLQAKCLGYDLDERHLVLAQLKYRRNVGRLVC